MGLGRGSLVMRWYKDPVRVVRGVLITLAKGYVVFLCGVLVGFLFTSGNFLGGFDT